jgi:hypothetical protein
MHRLLRLSVALITPIALLEGCLGFCGGAQSNQAEVSVFVSDAASGQPVPHPSFTENGVVTTSTCGEPDQSDPTVCTAELLVVDRDTKLIIGVSAPGYDPSTVQVDSSQIDSIHVAVTLHRAN